MKKVVIALGILLAGININAQKFAYVDTEYILDNVPEYEDAQKKLDEIAKEWQGEVEKKYEEIDKLYKAFQAEQILLSDEMKRKREAEIVEKERAAKELQKTRFGYEGDLFKKRQELVKPIQDKIYNAVKDMAEAGAYACIFDKAGTNMLYTSEKYDKSDDILEDLGYK